MYLGLCLAFWLGLGLHPAAADPSRLAWKEPGAGDELEGSFDERVHDLQNWLRQREVERRESWGNDVVTPENPALRPAPRYFGDRGYDAQSYRQLNDNTRFRLRGGDAWSLGDDGHAGSLRRSGRPPDDAAEAEVGDQPAGETRPAHRGKRKHGRRGKHRRR